MEKNVVSLRKSANDRLFGDILIKWKASFAVWRKSKKSEEFGTDGQDLFVLVNRQTVLPARCDHRTVALPTRIVANPLERFSGNPLIEKSIDVPGVPGKVADNVVVHQRVDAVRIVTHEKPATDNIVRHCSTVQRRLSHQLLGSRLHTIHD